jgi:ribosomal protein L9
MLEEGAGMLEVHPPQKHIHGVAEFFLHLFTITVGLLIALALENAAGAAHHRHQREQAETTIRQEMGENREHLAEASAAIKSEMDSMAAMLGYLEARSKGQDASTAGISLGFRRVHLQNAAWRTAGATGVVQYMHYDDVEKFAEAYDTQEAFNGLQNQTLENYLKLISYVAANNDPKNLSQADVESAISDVRNTIAHLGAMRDISHNLLESYDDALK